MRTISPGSTSRTYSASIRSNAQVSRGDDPGAIEAAEAERAEAAGIANRVHFIAREHQQRIRAFHLIEGVGQRAGEIAGAAARDQVDDHFGVAGGLEDGAAMLELGGARRRWSGCRCGPARACLCCNRSRWAARSSGRCRRRWSSACGRWRHRREGARALRGENFLHQAHAFFESTCEPSVETMPADSWPRCCRA